LIEEILSGESKYIEFKEVLPSKDNISKSIIAFSNTSGGKLVIGVNDKLEVVGINDDSIFELQDRIASIISDNCTPGVIPEIYNVNIQGKLVLVIEVNRGNSKPYYLKRLGKEKGTYIRIGATNRPADSNIILELERQKRNICFDEEICYEQTFEELDISPLIRMFESQGKHLDEDKLKNLKLIREDRSVMYPTNALMIILGKFWHCTVKCARFKGTTMSVFTDKKEYEGDIFSVLESTQSFVLNHINLAGVVQGLQRTDTYEIPVPAIREAIINAIVHRDYTNQGRDVKVGVYDDIVNIVSPGGLPNTITMTDVFNGRSEARNRVLAKVFKELNLIEQWGSGISRIINSCVEHGLNAPVITEKNDFFDVELNRPINEKKDYADISDTRPVDSVSEFYNGRKTSDNYGRLRTNTDDYVELSIPEREIILYVLEHKSISRRIAVDLLGFQKTKIHALLSELVDKGYLQKSGKGRSTYYEGVGLG
jgi:ATP-dependent DNA helicase RecG